jgi:hypothetical protein
MTVLHPVRVGSSLPATRVEQIRNAVVRRAVPIIAGSAAALVATLAAERAVREIAMSAAEHLGALGAETTPRGPEAIIRTVVTEVTVVERIRRRA